LKPLHTRAINFLTKYNYVKQYAFVADISILDNVAVAMETIHHMKCKVREKVGEVVLKIDISKKYDKVDWRYLVNIMIKTGFCEKRVKWIHICLHSIQHSIMVNGESVGPIISGRGLR
jgi:hypothetical protein